MAWVESIKASVAGSQTDPSTDKPWRTGWLMKKGKRRWFALDVGGQALYWFTKEVPLTKDERGLVKGFKNLAPLGKHTFCFVDFIHSIHQIIFFI